MYTSLLQKEMTYKEFLQYRIDNAADINTRKMYEKYLKKLENI